MVESVTIGVNCVPTSPDSRQLNRINNSDREMSYSLENRDLLVCISLSTSNDVVWRMPHVTSRFLREPTDLVSSSSQSPATITSNDGLRTTLDSSFDKTNHVESQSLTNEVTAGSIRSRRGFPAPRPPVPPPHPHPPFSNQATNNTTPLTTLPQPRPQIPSQQTSRPAPGTHPQAAPEEDDSQPALPPNPPRPRRRRRSLGLAMALPRLLLHLPR